MVSLDSDLAPQNSKLKVYKPAEISVRSDHTDVAIDSSGRILYRSSIKQHPNQISHDGIIVSRLNT